jgi:hypothetical protein
MAHETLHRLILTSHAFRQSSVVSSEQVEADPENVLLSRMPLRRLEAEALGDNCLLVAGCLDETRFGPPVPVQVRGDGLVTAGQSGNAWRRSIYGQQLRKEILAPTVRPAVMNWCRAVNRSLLRRAPDER